MLLLVAALHVSVSARGNKQLLRLNDTIHINLEIEQWDKRSPEKAIVLLQTNLSKCQQLQYIDGMMRCWLFQGVCYNQLGNFDAAEKVCRAAIDAGKDEPNARQYFTGLYSIISSKYQWQGKHEDALQHLLNGLQYQAFSSAIAKAQANRSVGLVLLRLKRLSEARQYIDNAIAIIAQEPQKEMLADFLITKGTTYLEQDSFSTARQYFYKALAILRLQNNKQFEVTCLNNIAVTFIKQEVPVKALPYLLDADTIKGLPPLAKLYITASFGEAYLALKQYTLASKYLTDAITNEHLKNDNYLLQEVNRLLSAVYQQTEKYKEALYHFQVYTRLKDSSTNKEIVTNISTLEAKYNAIQKDKQIADSKLEIARKEASNKTIKFVGIGLLIMLSLVLVGVWVYFKLKQKQKQKEQAIQLLQTKIEGIEQERTRLAQELHDGIGGILAAAQLRLGGKNVTAIDEQSIAAVSQLLQEASAEVRTTSHNLLPETFTKYGLANALNHYCNNASLSGSNIDLQLNGDVENIETNTAYHVYRIVQEIVQNIIKHAHSKQAVIQIIKQSNAVVILAEDDGSGFDAKNIAKGIGLQNIQSRVKILKGDINIDSSDLNGTTINITIPL